MSFRDKKRKQVGKNEAPSIGDTAEKLRLIRERQSKWMKERDEMRSSESSSTKRSSSNSPGSVTLNKSLSQEAIHKKLPFSSRSSSGNFNPRRKPLYPQQKTDRSNVITWTTKSDFKVSKRPPSGHSRSQSEASGDVSGLIISRSAPNSSKTYKSSNYVSSTSNNKQKSFEHFRPGSSKGVYRDDLPDDTEFGDSINMEKEDHRAFKKLSKKSEMESETKLSHFDSLISNVDSELPAHILDALASSVAEKLQANVPSEKNNRMKTSGKVEGESGMSSHYCIVCKELMVSPRHTPTAAIPCGHTCCKVCILDCHKCPTCGARIASTAVNTVLEAIIQDFKAEKERERLQKLEQETRKYVEEYQSLTFRCETLTGEAEGILENMESITNDLVEEKKAIKRLETENKQIEQKIQQFQEQLQENSNLKQKHQEKCLDLESKYSEEQKRLAMAEDTVRTIQKTKDKIKLLVQNLAPKLNLDKINN